MAELVIFDLDGTLADTIEDIAASVNGALARRGLPAHDIPAYKRMVGDGLTTLVTRALPPELRGAALVEELRAEAAAAYAAAPLAATRPYAGIRELLAELKRRGLPFAVLSNKPHALAVTVVAGLFPEAGFALVRGESPDFPKKPDPAAALDIARRLGAAPADCLYVGDSDVDMATARSAGMRAVGVAWGFRGSGELREAGADRVIEEPRELLALL
ncbi:MAG: HAD family hydrolase [Spirochaetaceae bacterium]|nr:HAD family hydrolase [Spirochaetaceae bacterium]